MTTSEPHAHGRVAKLLLDGGSSNLADGEWHRLHPLTPLFKGGLVFIVVLGIVFANLRDRLIYFGVRLFAPHEMSSEIEIDSDDPVSRGLDWVMANNLVFLVLLGLVVLVAIVIVCYWLVWRFQQFRITGENVEVKKGIIFRSQRRAPLDRVQGVNLTRPFPARLIGMAKLTLEGAGTGADVALEYLATNRAEQVRADILRLASGVRQAKAEANAPAAHAPEERASVAGTFNQGVTNIIDGVDTDDVVPESVVRIPIGRLIASQAITGLLWLLFFFVLIIAFVIVPIAIFEDGPEKWLVLAITAVTTGIPMVIAVVAIVWSALSKGFRFSIAPTPDGVRVSSGLLTTVTRTIPPGRVHAVEVTQSLLWRPFGWWSVRINRMGGQSASQQSSGQAAAASMILPVGTRADAERVVGLLLPAAPEGDRLFVWEHGMVGPQAQDPFTVIPKRAYFWHWLQRGRLGVRVTSFAMLVRRGRLGRRLAVFPLARIQGVSVSQGIFARGQRLAHLRAHTVPGPVSGNVTSLDVDDVQEIADLLARGSLAAAEHDSTHRWASV
ncbi:PH domain-containing protein [Microbacterium gubbeenense]|uniref:PH domain-containing protein n=1 Tax=Microbacterium gubbeenense TaxID=159896 RepID=UPI003F9D12AA